MFPLRVRTAIAQWVARSSYPSLLARLHLVQQAEAALRLTYAWMRPFVQVLGMKGDSYSHFGNAALVKSIIDRLPDIAREVASPLSKTEKVPEREGTRHRVERMGGYTARHRQPGTVVGCASVQRSAETGVAGNDTVCFEDREQMGPSRSSPWAMRHVGGRSLIWLQGHCEGVCREWIPLSRATRCSRDRIGAEHPTIHSFIGPRKSSRPRHLLAEGRTIVIVCLAERVSCSRRRIARCLLHPPLPPLLMSRSSPPALIRTTHRP